MSKPVNLRRRAFLSTEISKSLWNFPSADEITRQVVPVALKTLDAFDQREYAVDEWKRFFEEGMVEETMRALYFECLSQGVIEGTKYCNAHHEQPKTCTCEEVLKVVLGLVPATTPLSDLE